MASRDLSFAHLVVFACISLFTIVIVFILGLVILPVVGIAAGGYFYYQRSQTQKLLIQFSDSAPALPPTPPSLETRDDPIQFLDNFRHVVPYIERDTGRTSCKALSDSFVRMAAELYAQESFHQPPEPPDSNDLIARAAYQDKLDAWHKKTSGSAGYELFLETIAGAYLELRQFFPDAAFHEGAQSAMTVPLSIKMEPEQVTSLGAWFFQQSILDLHLFDALRDQMLTNTVALEEAKLKETFETIFARTPLASFSDITIPFEIPISKQLEHSIIVAGAGTGKTQTLGAIIASHIEREDPPAMVVIDSTGALIKRVQTLAVFNDRLKDRLVIIDPEHNPSPALNMFDIETPRFANYSQNERDEVETEIVNLFNYVFTSASNDLTSRQGTVFSYVVRLVLSMKGSTVNTLREVLEENPTGGYKGSRYRAQIETLDSTAQDFFRNQYFELKGFREQIAQRVYGLVQIPAFQRMFSTTNKVDFFDELQNKGSIILVNTSERVLKENGSPLFGRYIIARTMAAAFERATIPEQKRRPTFLIIDECAPMADDTFDKMISRVRQFKLGVCMVFQHMEQASEKLRSSIASNTSVKLAAGLGYGDSRWLSRDMETTPEFIKAQRRDGAEPPQWTQMACFVRNYTPRAVSLTIPFFRLEGMPHMTDAEHRALLARNRERVSAPPSPVRPSPSPPVASPATPVQEPPLATTATPETPAEVQPERSPPVDPTSASDWA